MRTPSRRASISLRTLLRTQLRHRPCRCSLKLRVSPHRRRARLLPSLSRCRRRRHLRLAPLRDLLPPHRWSPLSPPRPRPCRSSSRRRRRSSSSSNRHRGRHPRLLRPLDGPSHLRSCRPPLLRRRCLLHSSWRPRGSPNNRHPLRSLLRPRLVSLHPPRSRTWQLRINARCRRHGPGHPPLRHRQCSRASSRQQAVRPDRPPAGLAPGRDHTRRSGRHPLRASCADRCRSALAVPAAALAAAEVARVRRLPRSRLASIAPGGSSISSASRVTRSSRCLSGAPPRSAEGARLLSAGSATSGPRELPLLLPRDRLRPSRRRPRSPLRRQPRSPPRSRRVEAACGALSPSAW